MKLDIRNHSSMTGIEEVAKKLYEFAQKKLGFDKPARVVFESQGDRAVDMFSPTGNYNPQTKTITVFVDHRHPKDILRSMAHELIHHAQCCEGAFGTSIDTSPGYAQKDEHMRNLERDAYFWGNGILFRDWEDNHKQKRSWNLMNENKKTSLDEQKLRQKIRRMVEEILQEDDISLAAKKAMHNPLAGRQTSSEYPGRSAEAGYLSRSPNLPTKDAPYTMMEDEIEEGGYKYKRNEKALEEEELEEQAVVQLDPESPGGVFKPHLGPEPDSEDAEYKGVESAGGVDDQAADIARGMAGHTRNPLEEEKPLEEWYNDTLHEALLKKFKIKK